MFGNFRVYLGFGDWGFRVGVKREVGVFRVVSEGIRGFLFVMFCYTFSIE